MPGEPLTALQCRATVARFCRDYELLRPGALVVAVSGGADSVAVLTLLHDLCEDTHTRLVVAHFHHGLRGAAAGADAALVADLASRLGLPYWLGGADIARIAQRRRCSLEAAAHEERWAFLRRVQHSVGAYAVATGHTQDDQAETVLLHLFRGAGLSGLTGLRPSGEGIVRPLLMLRHRDTKAWCAISGLAWHEDASNTEPWCDRNRVRLEVVSWLEARFPALVTHLAETARSLQCDAQWLEEQVDTAWHRAVVRRTDGNLRLDLEEIRRLPQSVRRHLLHRVIGREGGRATIERAERLLLYGNSGDEAPLGGGRWLVRRYADALVTTEARENAAFPDVALPVPGVTTAPGWGLQVRIERVPSWETSPVQPLNVNAFFSEQALEAPVVLHSWRAGDRIELPHIPGTKKVHDLFVDAKVPRTERLRVPIIVTPRGIAWVAGLRVAAWARPQAGAPAYQITLLEPEAGHRA
ncbi:MAG: tRNA lysidine(34) synthetase TilS [Chloroflexi bacterium]|nr:tRNA lysidine(34) synthetase TilS [Chloroflexota bacterium]